jgi:alcohol dehydrogenase class IV
MKRVTLLQPGWIVFGEGCAVECADYFARKAVKRLLLVTSRSVASQLGSLIESLSKAGCELVQTLIVKPEPTKAEFEKLLESARAVHPEAVLGIGGGSALDVAKLIAALIHARQKVDDVFGVNLLDGRDLPLVCLPTTAGTGSEVSPNAVLLDEPAQLKKAVISPHLVPEATFVDPRLTLSVPPPVTAATGMDALTHCIEAYANRVAHPIVDVYALQGIRLISSNLLRAVRHGADLEARTQVLLGSLYGGLCLGPVNTAAVHALSYPLGGRFHVPHGVSNAVLLPHVLNFNLPEAEERYHEVAVALGANGTHSHGAAVASVANLSKACGVPQRLADLGIPRQAIPEMAKSAMQVTRLLKNNVRPVSEEDAIRIYEASY